jgi:transmembrane sensor
MNPLLQFPNDEQIRERAGEWMARLDRGINASEHDALKVWLAQDPRHRLMLLEISEMWDRMEVLTELSALFPKEARAPRPVWWNSTALRLSFGCLGALVVIYFAFMGLLPSKTLQARYRTAIGQQQSVTLPDKSSVMLNTNTSLAVHFTRSERTVDLQQGEAHFKVAKDADRVFTVRVGESEFKAVGTEFNLRKTSDADVELTVTEGRVKVLTSGVRVGESVPAPAKAGPRPVLVDAGKRLTVNALAQVMEAPQPAKIENTVAWTHGMIVFDGEPLERAVREVSRYSTIQFVISDSRIGQIPVVGYFKIGDTDGLVAALQANFDIDASREGSSIVLKAHHR